jgi:hypothetical protein
MKEEVITVTNSARSFADCVNHAHYQRTTFVLLKDGKPFARMEPNDEKRCTGRELADALANAELSTAEGRAWQRDPRAARKAVKPPAVRWE